MTFFKKILPLVFLIGTACSVSSVADRPFPTVPIDLSPEAQARFKAEWLAATAGRVYEGPTADVFGGGASPMFSIFAFDSEGNLHDTGKPAGRWYSLHRILRFKSGTEAVVVFYKTATGNETLLGQVYALEVRDNKIYRTQHVIGQKAMGFRSYKDWDKASYSSTGLEELAAFNAAEPYPPLTPADPNS